MRNTVLFNDGWNFIKEDIGIEKLSTAKLSAVKIPHTWNNLDGQDGGNNYYRGRCWYVKDFVTPALDGEQLWLEFAGVNSICELFVNGSSVGSHEGGFSRFRFEITPLLRPEGEVNKIAVSADNSANDRIYPQMADFTFYGGIYRNVYLIKVPASHFCLSYFGSPSIAVNAKPVDGKAELEVRAFTENVNEDQQIKLIIKGENAPEALIQSAESNVFKLSFDNPRLWNGTKDPYLYKAIAVLLDGETELDRVETSFGVRSFSFDADKGFFLNGESYTLRGVCRHQDRLDMGWAITEKEHEEDMALIREVGANTIRLAHYQHDEYFYSLCDKYGLVIWAEIPFISQVLENGHENEMSQMRELIVQNYNHASIVCWGLSNEITMGGESDELLARHKELNGLAKGLDPDRATTMAQVSMLPTESPMNHISDIISYNHYFGWYFGTVDDNAPWLDDFHANNPDVCFGVSEYGCEAILDWHSEDPKQGDYSEEYQAYYHEKMLEVFAQRDYLWATHVWNMFDFAADARNEGGKMGRNHKGLVTYDRKIKKDSFYIYKAWWTKESFVHVCGSRFYKRPNKLEKIKVYSNCPEVELFVNGKSIGKKSADKVFIFEAKLRLGKNLITAKANGCEDTIELRRVLKADESYKLKNAKSEIENWFVDGTFKYPEGYFSLKDKIGDVMKNPEGKEFVDKLMSEMMSNMAAGFEVSDGMLKVLEGMSFERVAKMAGDRMPKEMLIKLSNELNKIKK